MTYLRRICWAFPQRACFLGDCKTCQSSDHLVDFDTLSWMNTVLHFQVGNAALARTFQ